MSDIFPRPSTDRFRANKLPDARYRKKKKVKQLDVILFAGINDESTNLKGRLKRVKYSPVHVLSNQL